MKRLIATLIRSSSVAAVLMLGTAAARADSGAIKLTFANNVGLRALNPQPLPPGPDKSAALKLKTLNPQPLPPGPDRSAALKLKALNPQPLPPGPPPDKTIKRFLINPGLLRVK